MAFEPHHRSNMMRFKNVIDITNINLQVNSPARDTEDKNTGSKSISKDTA